MVRRAAMGDGEERIFEVCRLDESGAIVECECVGASELEGMGLFVDRDVAKIRERAGEDLLFYQPCSGEDEERLFTVADYVACEMDGTCAIPDDVANKIWGPDVVVRLRSAGKPAADGGAPAAGGGEKVEEESTPAESAARFHMHFGAGRLGLGLVVPAIAASGLPFAIVQRPKPRWQEIFQSSGSGTVELAVNDEVKVHRAEVIATSLETPAPDQMPPRSLVFAGSDLDDVLLKATSFSCSLGAAMNKVMAATLDALPELMDDAECVARQLGAEREAGLNARRARYNPGVLDARGALYTGDLDPASDPRPVLYACENDHAAVASLKTRLRTRVRVVDCMVDRVCTGRTIAPAGVEISAEPWPGAIVVLEPGFTQRQVPFCPTLVTLPGSRAEADYLSERKFSLVNGMHTVMAFLTLEAKFDARPGEEDREYVLLKYSQMRRVDQRPVEAWRTARIAALLAEFGVDNVMAWEKKETVEETWDALLEWADTVLEERFSAIDDLVSRVLGGGVANRWQTRLGPTATWMAERVGDPDVVAFCAHAARRDLRRAFDRCDEPTEEGCVVRTHTCLEDPFPEDGGAAAEYAADACGALVRDARQFCSKELEITHKALVKEQRKAGGRANAPKVRKAVEEDRARIVAIAQERRRIREAKQGELAELYDPTGVS